MTDILTEKTAQEASGSAVEVASTVSPTPSESVPEKVAGPQAKSLRERQTQAMPVLEKLAGLYPHLFGATFRPLKRGIFQDLMEAHADVLDAPSLKNALSFHTRSTRYLQAVATGQARQDLKGQTVEPMAPEHVHHALLEVYRRRKQRGPQDDARATLIQRLHKAFEASGLSPEDYRSRMPSRNEEDNALMDAMLEQARAQAAKVEALARAYQSSGLSVQAFAEMYGMQPAEVLRTLVTTRKTGD